MFKNEPCNEFNIKKLNKYLCKTESLFLNRLFFWSSHRKSYGIEKEGRVWIYNTLDNWSHQIGVSKSSVRRAIKSLKEKEFIDSNYLSNNRRNRTLYYSVNFEKINQYLSQIVNVPCVYIKDNNTQKNVSPEHMDEHLYIMDNSKQHINKSYKSIKNDFKKSSEQIVQEKHLDCKFGNKTVSQKPTIIQDMIRIWNEEFKGSKIELTKNLSRFLVAAFKTKFKSCLKDWKKYLKTLKTSVYLMSDKFKLSIWWVIKFITIDRIRAGELGVNAEKITLDNEELTERLNQHVERLEETDSCKKLRYEIIEKLSLPTYLSWFTHVSFIENEGRVTLQAESEFVRDWIRNNFAEQCGLCVE